MTAILDEICPSYIAEALIVLGLSDPDAVAQSFQAVLIDVDYSALVDYGSVKLPLEYTVTPPSPSGFTRQLFELLAPAQISFTPQEGGQHLVVIREVGHNQHYGVLVVNVEGTINDPSVTQGQSV